MAEGREGQGIGKSGDWKRKDRKRECGRMYKGGTGIGICKAGNYTSIVGQRRLAGEGFANKRYGGQAEGIPLTRRFISHIY